VVNMIHQHDCIGLITQLLQHQPWQSVYIGCAPSHPTRKDFYTHAAAQLGLTAPEFVNAGGSDAKSISGDASAAQLNYQYVYADIMQATEVN